MLDLLMICLILELAINYYKLRLEGSLGIYKKVLSIEIYADW